jgi:hypothetical protein
MTGITDKIRNAIQKIKAKVDGVLLKVAHWIADKAKKLWGGIKSGAAAVVGWFKVEKPVRLKNGESHTLKMDPKSPDKRLQIHTDPQPFVTWINRNFSAAPANGPVAARPAHPLLGQLQAAAQNIENLQASYASATTEADKITISNSISAAINSLATLLGTITPPAAVDPVTGVVPTPPTIFTYGGVDSNGFGQWAKAEFLSQNAVSRGSSNNEAGKIREGENVTGWNVVRRRLRIVPPFVGDISRYENSISGWLQTSHGFVRGHLMNGKLGGGAFPYNLTPITSEANTSSPVSHFRQVENSLQQNIATNPTPANPNPRVYNYEVHAIYGGHAERGRAPLMALIEQAELAGRIQRSKLRGLGNTPAEVAQRQTIETNIYNTNRVYAYARFEIARLGYEEQNLPQGFLTDVTELRPITPPSAPPNPANPPRWAPFGSTDSRQVDNTLPPFIINPAAAAALP